MKLAKLEIKMIVALFLTGFEYDLVDGSGKFPNPFPKADRNDIQQVRHISIRRWYLLHSDWVFQARPLGEPCYLRFKRVVE